MTDQNQLLREALHKIAFDAVGMREVVEIARDTLARLDQTHPDDSAVDQFAERMKSKLGRSRDKGRNGWRDPAWAPEQISQALREHVEKGDPVDVANYCMFLAARNEAIAPSAQPAEGGEVECSYCGHYNTPPASQERDRDRLARGVEGTEAA